MENEDLCLQVNPGLVDIRSRIPPGNYKVHEHYLAEKLNSLTVEREGSPENSVLAADVAELSNYLQIEYGNHPDSPVVVLNVFHGDYLDVSKPDYYPIKSSVLLKVPIGKNYSLEETLKSLSEAFERQNGLIENLHSHSESEEANQTSINIKSYHLERREGGQGTLEKINSYNDGLVTGAGIGLVGSLCLAGLIFKAKKILR